MAVSRLPCPTCPSLHRQFGDQCQPSADCRRSKSSTAADARRSRRGVSWPAASRRTCPCLRARPPDPPKRSNCATAIPALRRARLPNRRREYQHDAAPALSDKPFAHQAELDAALIALDGTPNKSRLGANALLAVSLAFARAQASRAWLRSTSISPTCSDRRPPPAPPAINLFSGGKHAGGQTAIQDVLIVPVSATI